MARVPVARVATLAVALALAWRGPAGAQLATLHVRDFAMTVDRASVRVGESFHLTISAHVDERILELDDVTLPDLAGFESLGDERRCRAGDRGSDCFETLTLAPTSAGEHTIAAAVLDAIDARNGKPSRFATNTLAIHVAPAPPQWPGWIGPLLWSILLALLPVALVAVAGWALIWGFRRTPPTRIGETAVATADVAPPVVDRDARLRQLVAELASQPTRERARAVRAELRARIGARDDETLADLTARATSSDRGGVLAGLRAIERAAFCEAAQVARASEEALPFLRF